MPVYNASRDTWDELVARIHRQGERIVTVIAKPVGSTAAEQWIGSSDVTFPGDGGYEVFTEKVDTVETRIPEPTRPNPGIPESGRLR